MIFRSVRPLPGLWTGLAIVLMTSGPAAATTGIVDWPTYFRTGPGRQFVVLEELSRGRTVDVLGCANQWCRVQIDRVVGYIDQANLADAAEPMLGPQPAAGCFDSQRSGYGRGEDYRYCPR